MRLLGLRRRRRTGGKGYTFTDGTDPTYALARSDNDKITFDAAGNCFVFIRSYKQQRGTQD